MESLRTEELIAVRNIRLADVHRFLDHRTAQPGKDSVEVDLLATLFRRLREIDAEIWRRSRDDPEG